MKTFSQFLEGRDGPHVYFKPLEAHSGGGELGLYFGPKKAGYITFYFNPSNRYDDTVNVDGLWVDPEFRSRGLATRLKQEFINFIKTKHRWVTKVSSDFLSRKALVMTNKLMGNPIYIGSDLKDFTTDVQKALDYIKPDAEEHDNEFTGPRVSALHQMPKRVAKKDLRQRKPWVTQMDLPFKI